MDLQAIRREYVRGGLHSKDLTPDPIALFSRWLQEAIDMGIPDANAMTVASVGKDGQPSQRIVLLKSFDAQGFTFFTNYESRKAREIACNARVSLHFPWHSIERQVEISGVAEKVAVEDSRQYFSSRPRESQLAAWASAQSRPLASKESLIKQWQSIGRKFEDADIPLPEFWGGYRVRPLQIEFWQGGEHRLHDRFEYTLQAGEHWKVERLAP
ncbi:MAG: pyridoxamine 5'-phosphate oxidase [Pseudomonadales bacterium]|nr:pyridoxamine 5'-phosphate oxidase [Pseudomonadales bacterium]MCP5329660.1 pyridoxamine 5'-phosphate oxidase [Pseudomonadales bacterium]MCP5343801.1 pyridoxamine 5'-phosphate oxidase [Pseudomonadales bacterium]